MNGLYWLRVKNNDCARTCKGDDLHLVPTDDAKKDFMCAYNWAERYALWPGEHFCGGSSHSLLAA